MWVPLDVIMVFTAVIIHILETVVETTKTASATCYYKHHTGRKSHITINDKPVVSEEYIVSLIMESYSTTTPELWFVMEKSCQHSGYCVTQVCTKVVEDHFRTMFRDFLVTPLANIKNMLVSSALQLKKCTDIQCSHLHTHTF
jgi:hypothetical protein